ncbi:hypothetical protein R3P38DRAFT_3211442 [Favolaschia claudopus]|uniref:F-box domain-containing protein n=1 Tax=Favolaschia claudopus TaxID=2862362 RepID=A0AAW0AGJ7_9AGAR
MVSLPPRVSLPPSVYYEVAHFSERPERLSLYRVSKRVRALVRGLLYRKIRVGKDAGNLVVRSLAKNPELPQIVELLWFYHRDTLVEGKYWHVALAAMKNLWLLIIPGKLDIPRQLIPRLPFQLRYFGSVSNVSGNWPEFLFSQVALQDIVINGEFRGTSYPGKGTLPALRRVKAQAFDLARLIQHHHTLRIIWLLTPPPYLAQLTLGEVDLLRIAKTRSRLTTIRINVPDFLAFMEAAPSALFTLRDIVLDEDLSWSAFTLKTEDVQYLWESPLQKLAASLDSRFESLVTVFLVFNNRKRSRIGNNRRLLSITDASCFATNYVVRSISGDRELHLMISDDLQCSSAGLIYRISTLLACTKGLVAFAPRNAAQDTPEPLGNQTGDENASPLHHFPALPRSTL